MNAAAIEQDRRWRSDPEIATELYGVSHEHLPEIVAGLRAELDALRERMAAVEADRRADVSELQALIERKHANQSEAMASVREALHRIELSLERANRSVESHGSQLGKLWEWRDRAQGQLWRIMAYLALAGGGGAAVGRFLLP